MSFSYLNKMVSSKDEQKIIILDSDLHFLEPIAKYLKYLYIGFVGMVESRSIHEDETVAVDWMIE